MKRQTNYTSHENVDKRGKPNHSRNLQQKNPATKDGYIHGQSVTKNYRYGATCSAKTGCGWVAIYNVLNFFGQALPPAEIIDWLEKNHGLFLHALFGTHATAIKKFFHRLGLRAEFISPRKKLDKNIKKADISILKYLWLKENSMPGGIHFVTVRFDKAMNCFLVYNEYANGEAATKKSSVYSWLKTEKSILLKVIAVSK